MYRVCKPQDGQVTSAFFRKQFNYWYVELSPFVVGSTRDQVSEEREAVGLIDAVVRPVWFDAVLRSEQQSRMDQCGSAEGRRAEAGLDVDPGHEGELLHPRHNVPVDNLVLGPAADPILLLIALQVLEL